MSIRRAPRPDSRFYTLNKDISEDARLSWQARGLLIYLLGKPDHWDVSVANLINQTKNAVGKAAGRDAVRVILKELEQVGYLKIDTARNGGRFDGVHYTVSEIADSPETEYPAPVDPAPALPETEYPAPANPLLASNETTASTEKAAKGASAEAPYAQTCSDSRSGSGTGQSCAAASADASINPMTQPSLSGMDAAVGSEPKKKGKPKATRGLVVDIGILSIPEWLPHGRLQAFIEHRKSLKKPMSEQAVKLLIDALGKLRAQGYDPLDAINRSIMNGWQGVFPPSTPMTRPAVGKFNPRDTFQQPNRSTGHEQSDDAIEGTAERLD